MKKLILLFAAILMASTGLWAQTKNVTYRYPVYYSEGDAASGIKEWKTASVDATVVTNSEEPVTWGADGTTTWYVVIGTDVQLSKGAICLGDVRLILADDSKLVATGYASDPDVSWRNYAGIQVSSDNCSLTIYGQAAQSGQLKATGGEKSAGIGGGNVAFGSNITINGGRVEATGGDFGAGIGAGEMSSGPNITINDGTITAIGGDYGAGIGNGASNTHSNITINGGTITAFGGYSGAGIGAGSDCSGSNITINDGTITAIGGDSGAGIGGSNCKVTIATSLFVKAGDSENSTAEIANTGADLATDLVSYHYVSIKFKKFAVTYGDNVTVSPKFTSGAEIDYGTEITFTAADHSADDYVFIGFYKESTFDTPITTGVSGQTYTVTVADAAISVYAKYMKYVFADYVCPVYNESTDITKGIEKWETETVKAYVVTDATNTPVTWGEAGETTWYVVIGEYVRLSQGAICAGDVNLILADGAKLIATGGENQAGIQVSGDGNSLTIYCQTAQSGQLEAYGGSNAAGIGGGVQGSSSYITINGGMVTATGGNHGAGIGGGDHGKGSNITINGGIITASGEENVQHYGGAGIGGGYMGSGSNITINGGELMVTGGTFAAGIGGGYQGSGSDITINGGTITASGEENVQHYGGAGIGGGYMGSGSNITINGGSVTANGKGGGAGIGGGYMGSGSNIIIYDGIITAISEENDIDYCGAGIGGGCQSNGSDITIYDGKVTATGGFFAAGIGGGGGCPGSYITINGGELMVTGGTFAAGIGGGYQGSGSYITINGGVVKARGGDNGGDALGNGLNAVTAASNIKVEASLEVKTGTTTIEHDYDEDIASKLVGIGSVTITPHYFTMYIDKNGVEQNINAWVVLSASERVTWGEVGKTTWYVVSGEIALDKGADCAGDVCLILADGAKLTVKGTSGKAGIKVSGEGISLTIYGQIGQTGQLIATGGSSSAGIGGGNKENGSYITINGGTVTATGTAGAGIGGGAYGAGSHITINGGMVTATGVVGAGIGGGSKGGIGSYIYINGGMVTATGNDNNGSHGDAIGNGASATTSSSNIFVANILTLKAGNTENPNNMIENIGDDLAESFAGKRYVTVSDDICNITVNQDPNNKANYYSTFHSGTKAYSVPEGVTAYTGVVDGSVLRLTPVADGIIPAGEAVILKLTSDKDFTATKQQFDLTAKITKATKSGTNALTGTDEEKTLGANDYALSLGQNGVGFYLWNGKSISAHKAYLTLDSPTMAKAFTFMFDDGETTAIEQPAINGKQSGDTYNLNGVRVDENYKGIVIKNGNKVLQK